MKCTGNGKMNIDKGGKYMQPIINPMWFYLIKICDTIVEVAGILIIILIIVGGIAIFYINEDVGISDFFDEEAVEAMNKIKSIIKKYIIILSVAIGIIVFVPDEDTIYKMIVASQVTPNNIELVGDTVENSIDYIFEKINSLKVEENGE